MEKYKKEHIRVGFWLAFGIVFLIAFLLLGMLDCKWRAWLIVLATGCVFLVIRVKIPVNKIRSTALWAICVCILALSIYFGRSTLSVSFAGDLLNRSVRTVNHIYARFTGTTIFYHAMLNGQPQSYVFGSWKVPEGYRNEMIPLSKSRAYLLTRDSGNHEKVIFQLHGGGYVGVFQNVYNDRALRYSASYEAADVFSLDYRTAPQHLFPAALEDAIEGYQWLLDHGYKAENIVFCGDSAGGGLALATALYLRDQALPLPKMLILASPWTDLSAEGASYSTHLTKDAIFGYPSADMAPRYPVPILYAGDHDLHDPYLSPAYGDYTSMPPMLIQTGSDEILLSDSRTVAEKAKAAGVDVKLIEYEGMYHCFYIATPFIREGKQAWAEIETFIAVHE